MHKLLTRSLLVVVLVGASGPLRGQDAKKAPGEPAPPAVAPAEDEAPQQRRIVRGLPLPDGDTFNVPINSTEMYSVAPYQLYDVPRSTRPEVADVRLPPRDPEDRQTRLPDSFIIQTNELLGATTLVLPLVKEGEAPIERRVEVLVIDEVSAAYKGYLETTIRRLFPTVAVDLVIANQQTAVLNGYVDKAELVEPISQLIRGFLAARTGAPPESITVVNAIRVTGAQQVQLKVVIAEVQRTKARNLGFDWQWFDLSPGHLSSLAVSTITNPGAASGVGVGGVAGFPIPTSEIAAGANVPFLVSKGSNYAFTGFLRALVQNNLGKILAEPILVTTSGQPAFFNSGGEVPILIPQGNSTISVEYRTFGTNVRFVPTVLGDGRIRLEVRPEVSERNDAFSVIVTGITVPGFTTRVAETTVELENGQTFAIAGLIQRRVTAQSVKIPIMGDIPIVGWAFQNKFYRQEETELLMLVTPHLVDAMDEGVCKLPTRESRVPNDVEFYLGSKFEPPCFDDPYKNHYQKHMDKQKPPAPQPVLPYDNYGKPWGMSVPMVAPASETIPAQLPAQGLQPAGDASAAAPMEQESDEVMVPALPAAVSPAPEGLFQPTSGVEADGGEPPLEDSTMPQESSAGDLQSSTNYEQLGASLAAQAMNANESQYAPQPAVSLKPARRIVSVGTGGTAVGPREVQWSKAE